MDLFPEEKRGLLAPESNLRSYHEQPGASYHFGQGREAVFTFFCCEFIRWSLFAPGEVVGRPDE